MEVFVVYFFATQAVAGFSLSICVRFNGMDDCCAILTAKKKQNRNEVELTDGKLVAKKL